MSFFTELHNTATLQALLKAAVDGIVTIDLEGRITSLNQAAESIFGVEEEAMLGKKINQLMPENYASNHDGYLKHYRHTQEKKIIGIGRQVEGLHSSGRCFPMELSVGEIEEEGLSVGYIGIIRDISARVKAEEDAKQNREQLAHMTRLNTMGEMAAGIAHEVNQPLTAIASYAQACRHLLADVEISEKVLKILEKIDQQALRASAVIQRLRGFVKKHSDSFGSVELGKILDDTLALARTDTRLLDLPVRIECPHDLPQVLADPIQVQQVLLNLVRNGVDAMMGDSEISSAEPAIDITLTLRDKETVEIVVRDYGPGLSEEAEQKLFHPFFTSKTTGMGIGLCVSRSIISAHGGELWHVPPAEGAGAEFHFTLAVDQL